jgi:hypothetical protein
MGFYNGRTAPSIIPLKANPVWRRIRTRRLVVGRWPRRREVLVITVGVVGIIPR